MGRKSPLLLLNARDSGGDGEKKSGPISENFFRRDDLLGRTGESVLEFSGPAGDVDLDGIQAAVLHPQAELFIDFLHTVLLQAIAHA